MPQITVICAVRNDPFLSDTIKSILSQVFYDWEMVIVDDGSTDNTPEVIKYFAKKDYRIRGIFPGKVGRGKALNLAVENSCGAFIANIDADDPSHPQRLELLYKAILRYPDFAVVGSSSVYIYGNQKPKWPEENFAVLPPVKDITYKAKYKCPVNHSSVIIKKDALIYVGGYQEKKRKSHFDYDLWVKLIEHGYKIGFIDLPLASKRLHKKQKFEAKNKFSYALSSAKVQARAIKALNGSTLDWLKCGFRFAKNIIPRDIRFKLVKRHRKQMKNYLDP